ncbi:MAG: NfeD family protein [candidate division Zixibacteria bacterium]|nr:NfeD family protein [candidate division Zixibacteria bacterium]MBU1470412.1 NfeD family protein [candidate division Zixibacteria bacterium]MBU2625834.1 NfeD family protein [candidate division Zixibacteria bacterium]
MTLSGFFFLCLLAGLIYAVISLIMSGGFGGADAAEVAADSSGIDAGDVGGEITFSPASPVVIATFITAFGAGGIVGIEGLKWSALQSTSLAVGSGLLIAGLVYGVLNAVYKRTQGSSEAKADDLIGMTAEVITPISKEGTGELAYVVRGARFTGAARSVDNEKIDKNSLVEIVRVVGSTMYVKPWSGDSSNQKG